MTADAWNRAYPVGQRFIYRVSPWYSTDVVTRSVAWELADGSAVVMLTGRTGGYSIDALDPIAGVTNRKCRNEVVYDD